MGDMIGWISHPAETKSAIICRVRSSVQKEPQRAKPNFLSFTIHSSQCGRPRITCPKYSPAVRGAALPGRPGAFR